MVQLRAAGFVYCNYDQKASVNEMLRKRGWRSLVQRRVHIRFVYCNYDQKASVNEMLRKRGWRSLMQRRVDARFVYCTMIRRQV